MERTVQQVQMAEIVVVENSHLLKTTLGSCVGIVLYDEIRRVTGLAHIMLPRKLDRDSSIGKYADTALPAIVQRVLERGVSQDRITARIAGGANMFRTATDRGIATIGEQNIAAVKELLEGLKIPVVFEDVGGEHGRTVVFDNETGRIEVKTLRKVLAPDPQSNGRGSTRQEGRHE